MNELERELVFSEAVKAGKRIYYFDVKQSRNGDRYLSITESKKIVEGTMENPRISFEKHKLFLYKEDYDKFMAALTRTLDVAKTGIIPEVPEMTEEVVPAPVAPAQSVAAPVVEEAPVSAVEPAPLAAEAPATEVKKEEDSFKIDLDF